MREDEPLLIPSRLYLQILEHAQEEWPFEACGIIGGIGRKVMRIFKAYNEDRSEISFQIKAQDQLRILEEIEKEGLSMIGIYHSHPKTDPYPSKRDKELLFYPEIFSVIVSLRRRERPEVKAFIIDGDLVTEVPIRLFND